MKNPDSPIDGLSAVGVTLLSAVLFSPSLSAAPLTASEARGKQLYLTGAGASGKLVKALVGPESTELSGADVPCAGCHGEDGHGRPEGRLVPTDITFEYVTWPMGPGTTTAGKMPPSGRNPLAGISAGFIRRDRVNPHARSGNAAKVIRSVLKALAIHR